MTSQALDEQDINFGIVGYFDAQTVSALEEDFQALVDDNQGRIILDLSEADFMDSSGLGSIVFLYKRLKAQKRDLVLSGMNGQPARLIRSLCVDKTITTEFIDTEEAAE